MPDTRSSSKKNSSGKSYQPLVTNFTTAMSSQAKGPSSGKPNKPAQGSGNEGEKNQSKGETMQVSSTKSSEEKLDLLIGKMAKLERLDDIERKLEGIEKIVDKIGNIEIEVTNMKKDQEEHKQSLEYTQKELDDLKETNRILQDRMEYQDEKLNDMQCKVDLLMQDRDQMKTDLIRMEDYSKRECLLFEGLVEEKNENCSQKVLNIIWDKLGIKDDIKMQRAHRLGTQVDQRRRAIIVRFLWYQDKQQVLRNAYELAKDS